jgi:ABC-2 type transport system permease protein
MTDASAVTRLPASRTEAPNRAVSRSWIVVAGQELRDLWLSGRGLTLMVAYTAVLSGSTYVVAINEDLNFVEQREAVSLTLKLAVVVGGLLVVLVAADAISGERERGTLEGLLLTPASRRELVVGKGLAALSLWAVAFALGLPYVWWLGRDVGTFGAAVVSGLVVGTMLALLLVGIGLLVSMFSNSNLLSLSISFFALLVLVAPNQMPTDAVRGWAGELLLRLDPFLGGLTYLDKVIINERGFAADLDLLLVPLLAAVAVPAVAVVLAGRLTLLPRGQS